MAGLDDDVGDMVEDFLTFQGASRTYRRGVSSESVTMARLIQRPVTVESNGLIVEVRGVDWIMDADDLPFGEPATGDEIIDGSDTYEVLPTVGEKVFRRVSPKLIRIHSKQVS